MAQLMEYAEFLSKEIGPRPAGTEEEQQAALYITECFQKDSGFTAQIEEFTCSSNIEILSAVPGAITIIVAILAMIFPMLSIPAFILAAAAAALYTLEAFGRPIVTRALARGASQNVVAKYQPNPDAATPSRGRGRSRKIVLVARYDSDKVTPGLVKTIESIKLPVSIGMLCVCGMIAAAFFLLLHVFLNAGVGGIIINVLTIISLVICAYPVLRAILYRAAPYNEGANNNATGAAALIEVARRISRGSVSEADLAGTPDAYGVVIHGEDAAYESGLVPEGAQIRYEAERLVPPSELGEYDEEERLLAAKAAIAALTGQPVERRTFGSVATHLVNSRAQGEDPGFAGSPDETPADAGEAPAQVAPANGFAPVAASASAEVAAAEEAAPAAQAAPAPAEPANADGYENAPGWFVAAQKNAKKPAGETGPIQRSRYAEAIEAAEREAAEREREREEAERLQREAELREREQAARAAIEQNAQAARAQKAANNAAEAAEPADVEAEFAAEPEIAQPEPAPMSELEPAIDAEPVFVPYSQAMPADDEFAASLGQTTAFAPVPMGDFDLTETDEAAASAPRGRLAGLPAIDNPAPAAPAAQSVPETASPSRSGMFRKLRADVPSMSGVIRMQAAGQDVSQPPVQQYAPAPAPAPTPEPAPEPALSDDETVAMPLPREDDLADDAMNPAGPEGYVTYEEMYGEPVSGRAESRGERYSERRDNYDEPYDDYDEPYDEPEQVEVPKTRAGGFFSRFRRKNRKELEETPQEWLDVDEDFDARTVGRERGGWESFRDDSYDEPYDDYEDDRRRGRKWEGGALSRVRLGRVDTRSGEDTEADVPSEIIEPEDDRQIADEIEQIYHFRNPLYNTEVWFVALGSEGASHDGVKAFLAEHADDLRGSMVIELESLGAGELCTAEAEGRVRRQQASSRIKRYTRSAAAATGITPGTVDLTGSDSAASILQAAGYQAMHLVGVEDGAPALKGSADDILENVDDLLFDDNVNFIMELLKK